MLRHYAMLAWISVAMTCSCATAQTPLPMIDLNAVDAAEPVQAQVGQVLRIRLTGNASTGYGWEWDEAAAAGMLVRERNVAKADTVKSDAPRMVGSPSTQTWLFRAAAPGNGELRLDYRRPWEKNVAPVQSVRLQIVVR
jgi:inhibitor of cysteine peptidase